MVAKGDIEILPMASCWIKGIVEDNDTPLIGDRYVVECEGAELTPTCNTVDMIANLQFSPINPSKPNRRKYVAVEILNEGKEVLTILKGNIIARMQVPGSNPGGIDAGTTVNSILKRDKGAMPLHKAQPNKNLARSYKAKLKAVIDYLMMFLISLGHFLVLVIAGRVGKGCKHCLKR